VGVRVHQRGQWLRRGGPLAFGTHGHTIR
jgi:hypothetical protein